MTVTDEMVERGAKALHALKFDSNEGWETHDADYQNLYRSGARAALTAALSEQAGGWQDISTAPKDGTRIEYHNGREIDSVIGYCRWATWPEDTLEDWWDYERDCEACPKFWRPELPLPAPPPSSTAGEEG